MTTQRALSVVSGGNVAWRHLNVDEPEVNSIVLRLRSEGCLVKPFQSGYSCEVDGLQIFRASRMDNGTRYHVRLNAGAFPNV